MCLKGRNCKVAALFVELAKMRALRIAAWFALSKQASTPEGDYSMKYPIRIAVALMTFLLGIGIVSIRTRARFHPVNGPVPPALEVNCNSASVRRGSRIT